MDAVRRGVVWGLLLCVLSGVALRFLQLQSKSLWADELFTLSMAGHHPLVPVAGAVLYERKQMGDITDSDSFLTAKAAEQSPPLNDLLEKLTVNWLGMTELAARLPAALASTALLLWFAWFAWRHPDPRVRRVLSWTVLLLAFYPSLVVYAQEGRAYSVGVSLVGMGGLLWLLRWRHGHQAWSPPGWGELGLFVLACYSHYNAALLVALLLVPDAVMATYRRSGRGWLRLLALGGVFLVWLALNAHVILFTSKGGVAWGNLSGQDRVLSTLQSWSRVLHWQWLVLAAATGMVLWLMRRFRGADASARAMLSPWPLLAVVMLYLLLAAWVVARAGMEHPRFYIFVLPLAAVTMAMVLAQVRSVAASTVLVATVLGLMWAPLKEARHAPNDDFRAMSQAAVSGSDKSTRFLFPWEPNRYMYRIYLERLLGYDPRPQMVGLSSLSQVADICQQLAAVRHVAVIGHESGRRLSDAVYAHCGQNWPMRQRSQFHNTYEENWRIDGNKE